MPPAQRNPGVQSMPAAADPPAAHTRSRARTTGGPAVGAAHSNEGITARRQQPAPALVPPVDRERSRSEAPAQHRQNAYGHQPPPQSSDGGDPTAGPYNRAPRAQPNGGPGPPPHHPRRSAMPSSRRPPPSVAGERRSASIPRLSDPQLSGVRTRTEALAMVDALMSYPPSRERLNTTPGGRES